MSSMRFVSPSEFLSDDVVEQAYRLSADVLLAGQPVRLHAYDHLGEGIVPWIYWVDDRGRLLLAVSGLEAYLLDSFRPSG